MQRPPSLHPHGRLLQQGLRLAERSDGQIRHVRLKVAREDAAADGEEAQCARAAVNPFS